MSIKQVVGCIRKLESTVSVTIQNTVKDLVASCYATFDGEDITKEQVLAIQDAATIDAPWKGTSSEGARRSELKALLVAYPYYLGEACGMLRRDFGELRRMHVLMLARELIKVADWKDAVTTVVKKLQSKKAPGSGRKATIGMGLGIIKNFQSRARNAIAFRKELALFCEKHNIAY